MKSLLTMGSVLAGLTSLASRRRFSNVRIKKTAVLLATLLIFPVGGYAGVYTVTANPPKEPATDELEVIVDGKPVLVPVPVHDRNPMTKAIMMWGAMIAHGIPGVQQQRPASTDVKIDSLRVTGVTFKLNRTREKETINNPLGIQFATVGFNGNLNGRDDDGNPSVFQAAIGSSGISLAANLAFDTLSSPTLNGLLTDVFDAFLSELSPSLQPNLSLDLSQDLITFQFPIGQSDFVVENFSSDQTLNTVAGLAEVTEVTEPPTATLLFVGILALIAFKCGRAEWRQKC
jgi:hypothetical protein